MSVMRASQWRVHPAGQRLTYRAYDTLTSTSRMSQRPGRPGKPCWDFSAAVLDICGPPWMQISLAQTAFAPEFVRMVHAKRSLEPGTRSRDAVLHQSTLFDLVGLLH